MNIIYEQESYKIIGLCMEIHRELRQGFSEIVYKDAMEYEFRKNDILYEREKEFIIYYKDFELPHRFYADLVVFEDIILEVKAKKDGIDNASISQTLNYMKAADSPLGLIINFGEESLKHKRLVF